MALDVPASDQPIDGEPGDVHDGRDLWHPIGRLRRRSLAASQETILERWIRPVPIPLR